MSSRKRGRSSWAERSDELALTWPPGPADVKEIAEWPLALADGLADAESMARLTSNFNRGVVAFTDYSGIECPKAALQAAYAGLKARNGAISELPAAAFTWARSCDVDGLCRQVLLQLPSHKGACVFGDLLDRLPVTARSWIEAATPSKDYLLSKKMETPPRAHAHTHTPHTPNI